MSDPKNDILAKAKFNSDGLIPAVVQDAATREVLTVAYMNAESLGLTLEKGETWFYSRSRKELWHKGATSGNFQKVQRVALDCDSDTVLVEVQPMGPACHTGAYSCFGVEPGFDGTMQQMYDVIAERKTGIAAKNDSTPRIVEEAADLLSHLVVTLVEKGVTLREVQQELKKRRQTGKRS